MDWNDSDKSATPTGTPTPPPGGRDAYTAIQAESFDAQNGATVQATTDSGGGQNITTVGNGDWSLFQNVDFGTTAAKQFYARVASGAAGGVSGLVEGTHTVYLTFTSGQPADYVNVNWFDFGH